MGFYIQDSYWEAVETQPPKIQQEVIWGITKLYFTGQDPELKGVSSSLFCMAKDRVLKARTKAEQMRNKRGTDDTTKNPSSLIESESESESENITLPKKGRVRFAPPSFEEAENYRIETNLVNTDTHQFLDYYEANGWVIGRNKPMKDWKAAMRNWDRRQVEWKKPNEKGGLDGIDSEYLQWANS